MTDAHSLHKLAMSCLHQANASQELGDIESYNKYLKNALKAESDAAFLLFDVDDSEPTRTILFKSAVSIARTLDDLDKAAELLRYAISKTPYNEERNQMILELYEIDELSKDKKQKEFENDHYYITHLRKRAVNFKVESKDEKYAEGVEVDHVLQFLRNVQNSYAQYSDVEFSRKVNESDVKDIKTTKQEFLKANKFICVDLGFKSFGVSVSVDPGIMNSLSNSVLSNLQKELLDNYMAKILMKDFNSEDYLKYIEEEYSEKERLQIFGPLIDSFSESVGYKVAISDDKFVRKIKVFKPVNKESKKILKPKIEEDQENETLYLKKTFDITDAKGKKKFNLSQEILTSATFDVTFDELKSGDKTVYFRDPYVVQVEFNRGVLSIRDSNFDVLVEANDMALLKKLYSDEVIKKWTEILSLQEKAPKELEFIANAERYMIRDWL